jgi:hypothetical protein
MDPELEYMLEKIRTCSTDLIKLVYQLNPNKPCTIRIILGCIYLLSNKKRLFSIKLSLKYPNLIYLMHPIVNNFTDFYPPKTHSWLGFSMGQVWVS